MPAETTSKNIISKVKLLVAEGSNDEALDLLTEYFEGKNESLYETTILLKGRQNTLTQKELSDTILHEHAKVERNQIAQDIVKIAGQIGQKTEVLSPKKSIVPKVIAAILILAIPIYYFLIQGKADASVQGENSTIPSETLYSGFVYDSEGNRLSDVKVEITFTGSGLIKTVTDSDGYFEKKIPASEGKELRIKFFKNDKLLDDQRTTLQARTEEFEL